MATKTKTKTKKVKSKSKAASKKTKPISGKAKKTIAQQHPTLPLYDGFDTTVGTETGTDETDQERCDRIDDEFSEEEDDTIEPEEEEE